MSRSDVNLAGRRTARVLAMQALYEADISPHRAADALERMLGGKGLDAGTLEFARSLVQRVEAHRPEIDRMLEAAAPTWTLDQMASVDRNILRVAIAEILFDNTVPLKAAINEAIELAKTFGSEHSPRFVNGVLGAVAQNSGRVPPTELDPPLAEDA